MIVEFAVILPIAILLSIGITDLGRLFWTIQDANRVTAQVARCGAVDTHQNCLNLIDYANKIDYPMSSVTYTATNATCGAQPDGTAQPGILVTANIKFEFIVYGPASLKQWNVSTCYAQSS